ncbi:hypothetical protein PK35_10255 [Tamlana nanhaiensis]|uniref:Uncharacterized protein n=1 Tax=Neotamlana nanhaiensis TaxID=1382798 RepID=A0A0D7W0G2_9FLAO|nr:hypothetical protein [Tamlana nanhaiensis]KJD32576.1 hypothetical protein PK35_10255 [Tamlana nanhaiensis]
MKIKLLFATLFISTISYSQFPENSDIFFAKEFSKNTALYKAKEYVMTQIIGVKPELTKFQIDPLAAASSGELTSLVYNYEKKNITGLVLGFYGDYWNDNGVVYQAYAFKNLPEENALEILRRIDNYINNESKYLSQDSDNNNMFFQYDDMTFLIYQDGMVKIRVFWKGFDSEWESTAFGRTKRRFERKIKKN